MPAVELRPVGSDDAAFLATVYAGTRADEMAAVPWTDDEKRRFLDFQHKAQTHSYATRFPDSDHHIILIDGEPAGRMWVDERTDEIRLLDIAILPAFRDRGAGTILLRRLQERAVDSGRALRHSVEISNRAALRFYQRLGFSVVDDYDFETHLLMEWPGAEGATPGS